MVKLVISNLIFLLVLILLNLSSRSDGVNTGPFIRDLIKPTLNNRKQGVYLADFAPDHSVVLNFPEKVDVAEIPKAEVEEGEFFVKAPNNYALIAVVQYLNFRTQIRGPSVERAYKICRDYIKLSDNRGKESEEICGYVYFRDTNIKPEKLIGQRTFFSANGEINVKLFIDKSTDEELAIPLWNSVQLTFTAVSECKVEHTPGEDNVRSCYPNQTVNDHIPSANCISSSLFCDEHFHCGFDGLMNIGTDESDCLLNKTNKIQPIKLPVDEGSSNSVLMILFTFLGLILIIVFIGAYVMSEYNLSCSSCLPRSLLRRGVSNTHISKAVEIDEGTESTHNSNSNSNSISNTPSSRVSGAPSNYSSFTIAEPR